MRLAISRANSAGIAAISSSDSLQTFSSAYQCCVPEVVAKTREVSSFTYQVIAMIGIFLTQNLSLGYETQVPGGSFTCFMHLLPAGKFPFSIGTLSVHPLTFHQETEDQPELNNPKYYWH